MMAYRVLQRRLACARFGHPCLPKTVVQFQFSNGLLFSVMDQLEKATKRTTSYDLQRSFGPGLQVWYIRIPKHGCGYNHVEYSSLL
jgi:hypothetical protein